MFCPIIWQEQFCSCDQVWVNQINCLINSSCWVTQSEMILGWVWAAHRSLKGGWMMWSDTDTPAGVEETNSQVVKRGGMWQGLGAVLGDVRASWVTVAWRQRQDWGSGFRQHLATRGDPKLGQVATPQTACFGAVTSVNPHPDSWPRRALRDTPVCPARWGLQWLVGTDKEHNDTVTEDSCVAVLIYTRILENAVLRLRLCLHLMATVGVREVSCPHADC